MEKETEEKIEEKDSVEAGYTVGDYFDISPSRRKEIMEDISKLFAETQNVETVEMAIKETFDNGIMMRMICFTVVSLWLILLAVVG